MAVSGHDPEMVGGIRSQAADVRTNRSCRIPTVALAAGRGPIAGRRAILEMNAGRKPVRIDRAIQCG